MKNNFRALLISIFLLFLATPNLNAMPNVSDVIKFPFKVIAKPFVWWRYGWERKIDEYKVEITYDLEFRGKPLEVVKAINCTIFEGSFRWQNDGIRRPSRRVVRSVNQVTHEIEETGEILVLPIPGYCYVDKAFREEKILKKNGKTKTKIIAIDNKTKSFIKLKDSVIQSPAIVKFSEKNPDQIDYIERVISPKLYKSGKNKLRIKSSSFRLESKENPITTKLVDPEIENRFSWINGKSKDRETPSWGTYKDEDKGAYAAFGMFKYPKEIWSAIPAVDEFIGRVLKRQKHGNRNGGLIYITSDDEEYKDLGAKKAIDDAKYYLANLRSDYSLSRYFGRLGINEEDTSIARIMTIGTDIMKKEKGGKWLVAKGRESQWRLIVENSNYRDYYYPFVFNSEEKLWQESEGGGGELLIYKTSQGKGSEIDFTRQYRTTGNCEINNKKFDKKIEFMLYDMQSKEIILVPYGQGIILK